MPGKQPAHTRQHAALAAPALQLYLQLYRENHAALLAHATAAGFGKPIASCLVTDVLLWLYAQPALLAHKEAAQTYLTTTLAELVNDVLYYQQQAANEFSATAPRYLSFKVLAAKHPQHFEQAILALPYPGCASTYLCYQGFTEKEIASRVNIALSIVKRRLSFSLYLLKTQFAKKPKAPV